MTLKNSISPCSTLTEKIEWLQERYWRFGREDRFLDLLTDIFTVDDCGEITPTPVRDPLINETMGIMLLAGSGNGKSALLNRTLEKVLTLTIYDKDTYLGNTLQITVPPAATIKSLAEEIALLTGYEDMDPKIKIDAAWKIARHRMQKFGIKLLIIDEAHHLLRPGPGRDVPGALQTLKHFLQGDTAVAVILSGVEKLRESKLHDPETDGRYLKFDLRPIQAGSIDAERLSKCIEKSAEELGLTLDPNSNFMERVLFAEHGKVGRSIRLAKNTMRRALIKDRKSVDLQDAEVCFGKYFGTRQISPFSPGPWSIVKSELEDAGWAQ